MFSNYLKHVRSTGKRYFTLDQAVNDLKKSRECIIAAIYRMKNHGELISPAKSLYVIVAPENQSNGCLPADELVPILMKYLKVDYYVGLLSAAMYYGASHQKPGGFQIILNKKIKRKLIFGQIQIDCIQKKIIKNLPVKEITVNTGYLRISSPELTAMDLLNYPKKSGGLNHIATVLSELFESLDPDKLIELAEQTQDKLWLQRLGYILENINPINVEYNQTIIDTLAAYLALQKLQYIPLASEIVTRSCSRSKKWMIIENSTIESDL